MTTPRRISTSLVSRVAAGWALCLLVTGCADAAGRCQASGTCVDCTSVCSRMEQCRVGYGNPLPVGDSQRARCEWECLRSDTITPDRARCIEDANNASVEACQADIIGCLGVDAGSVLDR